jgi:hypothetical protein
MMGKRRESERGERVKEERGSFLDVRFVFIPVNGSILFNLQFSRQRSRS